MRRNVFSLIAVILILAFIVMGVTGKGKKDSDPGSSVEKRIALLEAEISQLKVILSKDRNNLSIAEKGGEKAVEGKTKPFSGPRSWTEGTRCWAEDGTNDWLWTADLDYNVGIGLTNPAKKLHIVGTGDLTFFDNTGGYRAVYAKGGQSGVQSYVIQANFSGTRGSAVRGYIDAFTSAHLAYIDAGTSKRYGLYAKGEDYAAYTKGKVLMEGSTDYFMQVNNTGSNGCIKAECDCGWSEAVFGWNTNSGAGAYGMKAYSNGTYAIYADPKITATGYDTHAKGKDGKEVRLSAITSPREEYYSSGSGSLVNGKARIEFDDVFKNVISTGSGVRIILTPTNNCEGLYIASQDENGFVVRELRDGRSNASFNWLAIGGKID